MAGGGTAGSKAITGHPATANRMAANPNNAQLIAGGAEAPDRRASATRRSAKPDMATATVASTSRPALHKSERFVAVRSAGSADGVGVTAGVSGEGTIPAPMGGFVWLIALVKR
ncbi:MAG: hypothetical protein M3014_00405 [Chloroflexota bacterium]|nr:hypothetical protein [Chloroflexota bacterium]